MPVAAAAVKTNTLMKVGVPFRRLDIATKTTIFLLTIDQYTIAVVSAHTVDSRLTGSGSTALQLNQKKIGNKKMFCYNK